MLGQDLGSEFLDDPVGPGPVVVCRRPVGGGREVRVCLLAPAQLVPERRDEAEDRLRAAGCPKINLQVRNTNDAVIEFYKRIGFKTDDVVSLSKRLELDQ